MSPDEELPLKTQNVEADKAARKRLRAKDIPHPTEPRHLSHSGT